MIVTDFRVNLREADSPTDNTSEQDQTLYIDTLKTIGMEALQNTVVNEDDETGKTNVIPYEIITNELWNVIKLVLPMNATLNKYRHDHPPMDALGLLMFAKMGGYFTEDQIKIYYHDTDPDPIAIGTIGEGTQGVTRFLIAAWGPEKVSYEQLMKRGKEKFLVEAKQKIQEAKRAISSWNEVLAGNDGDYSWNYFLRNSYMTVR